MKARLVALCQDLGLSQRQFSISLGLSPCYLGNLKDDVTVGVVNKILVTYPRVSMPWLVAGQGEMYIQEPLTEDLTSYIVQENKELKKENKELYAEVILLRERLSQLESSRNRVDIAADGSSPVYYRTFKNRDPDKG